MKFRGNTKQAGKSLSAAINFIKSLQALKENEEAVIIRKRCGTLVGRVQPRTGKWAK